MYTPAPPTHYFPKAGRLSAMPASADGSMLRVMITDDHLLVCSALAHLVRSFPGLKVVAELADGRQLLDALAEQEAEVAIVDAAMPVLDGFETVARVVRDYPEVRTLVLSGCTSPDCIRRAWEMGADAFVTMDVDAAGFEHAIRRVARSDRFLIAPEGLESGEQTPSPLPVRALKAGPTALTLRQREVLQLIVEGLSTKEIAPRLGVSIKTVEAHRFELKKRLGVRNVAGLVREALRLQLLPPES